MANLPESPKWGGIYQLEKTDPVLGGEGGISNRQATELGNRTAYLKQQQDSLNSAVVKRDQNLADLPDKAAARTHIELGTSATLNVGTAAGTVAAGNDSRITGALQTANALSELVATAATARGYLGLKSGATAAVQTSVTDTTTGALMSVGAFGWGGSSLPNVSNLDSTTNPSGVYYSGSTTTGTKPGGSSGVVLIINQGSMSKQIYIKLGTNDQFVRTSASSVFGAWVQTWTTENTTVDTNGFVKKASPVVQVKGDGASMLNNESRTVTTTRLGTGVYQVSGVMGFNADTAWHIEVPKDENGQPLIWIDYEVSEDGDITVRSYHRTHPNSPAFAQNILPDHQDGDPIDIPAGRWLDLRVQVYGVEKEPEPTEETVVQTKRRGRHVADNYNNNL